MMMMGNMGGSGGSMGNMGGSGGSMGNMGMDMMNMGGGGSMNGMDPNAMMGMYGNGAMGNTGLFGGSGLSSWLGGIFNLAVDLLAILLVVGLVAGVVILLKKYLFEGEQLLAFPKGGACAECGRAFEKHWKFCPKCGSEAKVSGTQSVVSGPQTA